MAWHYCAAAKRGPFGPWEFSINDAAAERRGGAVAGAQSRTRAITACKDRSLHAQLTWRARHDPCMQGAVTALTPQSQHARFGHCTCSGHSVRSSATARALRSLCALRSLHGSLDSARTAALLSCCLLSCSQNGMSINYFLLFDLKKNK